MIPHILQPEDVTVVGWITKPHGYKGSVKISIEHSGADNIETEWVMLMIDQKPVPFFIESIQRNPDFWIVKLENIETDIQAMELKGVAVAFPNDLMPERELSLAEQLIGFNVQTEAGEGIGRVTEFLDHGYQQLILVTNEAAQSFMIPFVEPIIVEISTVDKSIIVDLPEGLIELN